MNISSCFTSKDLLGILAVIPAVIQCLSKRFPSGHQLMWLIELISGVQVKGLLGS